MHTASPRPETPNTQSSPEAPAGSDHSPSSEPIGKEVAADAEQSSEQSEAPETSPDLIVSAVSAGFSSSGEFGTSPDLIVSAVSAGFSSSGEFGTSPDLIVSAVSAGFSSSAEIGTSPDSSVSAGSADSLSSGDLGTLPDPAVPIGSGDSPRFSRAVLALTAAATIAVAPLAAAAVGPADSGQSAHSIPVYLISRISHDIGHNDWAFQGQNAGRVDWVVSYVALGLFWLIIALWLRTRAKKESAEPVTVTAAVPATASPKRRVRLWLRVLLAAWFVETVTGVLTLAAGVYTEWTSTPLGPAVLHVADLCSPWWSCVAAGLVVARTEHSTVALRAILGYAALLAIVLLVPLPGPDALKVLLLALPAAVPALLTPNPSSTTDSTPAAPPATSTRDAALAG